MTLDAQALGEVLAGMLWHVDMVMWIDYWIIIYKII